MRPTSPSLAAAPDVEPGRVAVEFNYLYRVYVESGEMEAVLAGRFKHHATSRGDMPAVGDWVAVRRQADPRGAIVRVLPRRTRFSRRMAGNTTDEQVVAANVNVIFITMALDADFSVRRLERYLLMSRESGADPVVVLTKPDLADDLPARVPRWSPCAAGAPVHVVSPNLGEGLEPLRARLAPWGHRCTARIVRRRQDHHHQLARSAALRAGRARSGRPTRRGATRRRIVS